MDNCSREIDGTQKFCRSCMHRFDVMEGKFNQKSFEKFRLFDRPVVRQQQNGWYAETQPCVQPRLTFNNR